MDLYSSYNDLNLQEPCGNVLNPSSHIGTLQCLIIRLLLKGTHPLDKVTGLGMLGKL